MTRKNLARESSLNGSYRLSSQIEPRSQYQLVNPKITKLPLPFFVQEVRDKNVAIVRMLASLDLGYQLPSEEKLHDGMPGPFWNQPQYLFLALLIGLIIICFFPIARSWTQQPSADLLGKDLAESNETVAIMTVFLDSTCFF